VTALQSVVLALAGLLPQEAPRIDDQPRRVCFDAQRAIFQVENRAAVPVLAALSVERWSDEGDTPAWVVVQPDITQREGQPKEVRNVKLDARQRRNVVWELKKRVAPPSLATGRHRLVVTYSFEDGGASGTVTHEFVIADCGL
jgi:P pilus assembly chaperone PapD